MKSFGITDIGISRKYNQDYSLECDEQIGNLPNLYVVCDGLGGHNAGEFASSATAETFFDIAEDCSGDQPLAIFKEAVTRVNALLYKKGQEDPYKGMATTLVALTVDEDDNTIYVCNVGDSRCYICGEEIIQVTNDHSYVGELIRKGQITKDEARFHKKNNVITRAVGAERTVEADYFQAEIDDDEILLMCSDGLYNMLSESKILEVVNSNGSLKSKAQKLVDLANEAGGLDNIAVVLVSK